MEALAQNASQVIFMASCLVIFILSEQSINRMTHDTPASLRASFLMLAIGSSGGVLFTLSGQIPDWINTLFAPGIAALLVCERRANPPPPNTGTSYAKR